MDCCESPTSSATSRRALLLGGASFAAWAYLPKFARAADGRDPRLIVVILRGALDGLATVAPIGDPDYAGLHGSIALTRGWPACRDHAGLLLRAASVDAGIRADVSRQACRRDSRGGDALSRPLAFRRPGRARKRLCRAGPRAVRLAQSRAGSVAARRARDRARSRSVRPRRWCCAARRRPSAGRRWRCRRPTTIPRCGCVELYRHRDPALATALSQGLQLDKAAQGDDMKPKPGGNGVGAMRQVARGAAKLMAADDGPRIARARLRRLGYPRQ